MVNKTFYISCQKETPYWKKPGHITPLRHGQGTAEHEIRPGTNMIKRTKSNYFKTSFRNSKGNSKDLFGGDNPTRQPESLKVTEETEIISTAADIADYLICTLQLLQIKHNDLSWPQTFAILKKLKQFVSERLPSELITVKPIPIVLGNFWATFSRF